MARIWNVLHSTEFANHDLKCITTFAFVAYYTQSKFIILFSFMYLM